LYNIALAPLLGSRSSGHFRCHETTGDGMVQPSNKPELTYLIDEVVERFSPIERRLDLVHRYKKYFDQAVKISSEQQDFINGFMRPNAMLAFVVRYELAIAEAIEIEGAAARKVRLSIRRRDRDARS
jgi:hypothetical protein